MNESAESALNYLPARGILPESASAHCVEVVVAPNAEQTTRWLGHSGHPLEAAVVFPNLTRDTDGTLVAYNYAVRCFPAVERADGSTAKFLATAGIEGRPYIPPSVWSVASDISAPIYIIEKQAAALVLWQSGYHAIALDGTWGAARKRVEGERVELHPNLTHFDWVGRPVYLCFDSDFRKRKSVLQGLVRTFVLFLAASAVVKVIQWGETYTGLDDFIAFKAKSDIPQQQEAIEYLTRTVSDLTTIHAANQWLIPQYRTLFEKEIAVVKPAQDQCCLIAECVCDGLGTTSASLRRTWSASTRDPVAEAPKDELLEYFASILPWPTEVPLSEILWMLKDKIDKYVIAPDFYKLVVLALVPVTYVYAASPYLPLIVLTSSEEESGKSAFIMPLQWTVYRPITTVSLSSAGAFRWIDELKGTIVVDEMSSVAEDPLARQLFNSGFYNSGHPLDTARIRRVQDPKTNTTISFGVNYFKILGGIGKFLTNDTLSRSIVVPMMKATPAQLDTITDYAFITPAEFIDIQRMLTRWRENALPIFRTEALETLKLMPKDIRGRRKQAFCPAYTVGRLAGKGWFELIDAAATAYFKLPVPGKVPSLARTLLRDLYFIVQHELKLHAKGAPHQLVTSPKGRHFLTSDVLIKSLRGLPEGAWKRWGKGNKVLDANDMYWLLAERGIPGSQDLSTSKKHQHLSGLYTDTINAAFTPYLTPHDKSPFHDADDDNDSPDPFEGVKPEIENFLASPVDFGGAEGDFSELTDTEQLTRPSKAKNRAEKSSMEGQVTTSTTDTCTNSPPAPPNLPGNTGKFSKQPKIPPPTPTAGFCNTDEDPA